jgi:hypothetical protein
MLRYCAYLAPQTDRPQRSKYCLFYIYLLLRTRAQRYSASLQREIVTTVICRRDLHSVESRKVSNNFLAVPAPLIYIISRKFELEKILIRFRSSLVLEKKINFNLNTLVCILNKCINIYYFN